MFQSIAEAGERRAEARNGPLIILQDMQRHSLNAQARRDGGALYAHLDTCRAALRLARLSGWPIGHVLAREPVADFDPTDMDWRPIEGFEPLGQDRIYFTQGGSAFDNAHFSDLMWEWRNHDVLLLSAGVTKSCSKTLADARMKGINLICINGEAVRFDDGIDAEDGLAAPETDGPFLDDRSGLEALPASANAGRSAGARRLGRYAPETIRTVGDTMSAARVLKRFARDTLILRLAGA